MKKNELGINVVEKLLESDSSVTRLRAKLRQGMFSAEAARFVLDKTGSQFAEEVMTTFSFSEIFSTFEDYITSKLSKSLYESEDSNLIFHWIDCFPKCSEELMALYNKQDTAFMKKLIFKNILYRQKSFRLAGVAREDYLNCFEAILEIERDNLDIGDNTLMDCLTYLTSWSLAFSYDWCVKIEELVGTEEAVKLILKRITKRSDYYSNNIEGLLDIEGIYEYLSKAIPTDKTALKTLFSSLYPMENRFMDKKERTCRFELSQSIYKKHISPLLLAKEGLGEIYVATNTGIAAPHRVIFSFEKDHDILDAALMYCCKLNSPNYAIQEILYLSNIGIDLEITPLMETVSKICSKNWLDIIITKPLTTAEEILQFNERTFPFKTLIEPFSSNPFAVKNINFSTVSFKDINTLSSYINWQNIAKYFKDEVVPFDFLISNKDRIKGSLYISRNMIDTYTPIQCVELVENFTLGENMLHQLVTHCFTNKKDLTAESAARLLKKATLFDFGYGQGVENKKVDLQSVLTLI